jgi:hypothetical protein
MQTLTTIGLDKAKSVFQARQVHGVDSEGRRSIGNPLWAHGPLAQFRPERIIRPWSKSRGDCFLAATA